jgi:competence protein ComEC
MSQKILLKISIVWVIFLAASGVPHLSEVCPTGDICEMGGKKIKVEGRVVSLASDKLEKTYLELETSAPRPGRVQVVLPHTQFQFHYGDSLTLEGQLKLPRTDPEDNFSYPLYLAGQGIYSVMTYPLVVAARPDGSSGWVNYVYSRLLRFREKVRASVNRDLPEPCSSIVNAMIIGDQGSVPLDLRQKLSETGIVHILSVSGAHVTLVISLITLILGKFIRRRLPILLLVASGVIGYLLLAGSPNCASRSAIMGLLLFLALSAGRSSSFKTAMWLSAAILLSLNPVALYADVGFELSFLAVLGMVYVFPVADKLLIWGRTGLIWKLVKIILLSISISLTTTPLVYYYFGIISWISPLANLILLPLFSLVLPLGFLLVLAAMAISGAAVLIAVPNYFLLRFIGLIVDLILKIPFSYTSGAVRPGWIILYYLLLLGLMAAGNYLVDKYWFPYRMKYFASDEFLEPVGKRRFLNRPGRKIKKAIAEIKVQFNMPILCWLVIVGCLFFLSGYYFYCSSRPPRLVMLNVGQGDAFLLDWPRYHLQILVDGGPGRRLLPELGEVLPFYDRRIETVILSHPHQDHLEGLVGLFKRYQTPYQAILPELPTVDSPELYKIWWSQIMEKPIKTSISRQGQKIIFSKSNKIAELEFLTPLFDYARHRILNLNDQSVILRMNYPQEMLFMGDATKKLEEKLLNTMSYNLQADILKVGHHGSRFSTSDEFLKAVQPRTALVSVGKNNLYGHPAEATIKKMEERNIQIFRTDINGRIELPL